MDNLEVNKYDLYKDGSHIGSGIDVKHSRYKSNEPPFVKAYLKDIRNMLKVHSGDISVLLILMSEMSYGNVVDINPRMKEHIIATMGYGNMQTVNNSITRLKKAFLIISINRGSYLIDPKLFAKGKWADVAKIQLKITYNKDGSKFYNAKFEEEHHKESIQPNTEFDNEETE